MNIINSLSKKKARGRMDNEKKLAKIIDQLQGIVGCEENTKMHNHCKDVLEDEIKKLKKIKLSINNTVHNADEYCPHLKIKYCMKTGGGRCTECGQIV